MVSYTQFFLIVEIVIAYIKNRLAIFVTDPCRGIKCKNYGVCKGKPQAEKGYKCVCRKCLSFGTPVCGSNRRTYKSECFLRRTSCRKHKYLFVAHVGPCGRWQTIELVLVKNSCLLFQFYLVSLIPCTLFFSTSNSFSSIFFLVVNVLHVMYL